jgi:hypothetical protein
MIDPFPRGRRDHLKLGLRSSGEMERGGEYADTVHN